MDYKLLGIAIGKVLLCTVLIIVAWVVMLAYPVSVLYGFAGLFVWIAVRAVYKDLLFKKRMKESNERWEEICRGRKPRMPAK